ncbi:MAG: DnaD domain-containing protein [Bulleidia sp.]
MKWYEERFVSHRDWILDHLELLGLSPAETITVLMIDFMDEHQMKITVEDLAKKTGMTVDETNETISTLCAKKYLQISAARGKVRFSLSGLYETDVAKSERILDSSLFELFETEFRRPLTQMEMTKISEWNRTTDRKLIIYALREASAYCSLSINYIDSILRSWKEKGYTAEMIEEGKLS